MILSWKESLWCISVTAVSAGTLAVAIASFSNPEGCFWAKLPATSVASVALIMVFGWLTQRELARGLTFGGDQIRWTWPQPALMALAVKIERHRVDVNWLLPTSAFQCRAERGR